MIKIWNKSTEPDFKQSKYITSNLLDLGTTKVATVTDIFEKTTIIHKIRYQLDKNNFSKAGTFPTYEKFPFPS
jgi:hypothetical protein